VLPTFIVLPLILLFLLLSSQVRASWHCYDRKAHAACAQSLTLWQQATIEITCRDHSSRMLIVTFNRSHASIIRDYTPWSLYYCLLAPDIYILSFFVHIPFVVNHNQHNATDRLQTTSPPFYNERTAPIECSFCEGFTEHISTSWSQHHFVAIRMLKWHVRKASHCGSKQQ